jgi:metal-responsive CopG/Arc/MetJ family transcriptional regulator
MSMKNIQVTVDEETLRQIDKVSGPLGLKRSEIVRQALRQWLQKHATDRFEQQWIAALGKAPDDPGRADDWLDVQAWRHK